MKRTKASVVAVQNIPVKSELGREIRKDLFGKPDFISSSYEDIEVRIIANIIFGR